MPDFPPVSPPVTAKTPVEEAFAAGWVPKPRPVPFDQMTKTERRKARAAARGSAHLVYFIQAIDAAGPIKVGVALNPMTRLSNIAACSPHQVFLRGVVPGSFDVEKEIHRHLAGHRMRGEWFAAAPEVLIYVRRLIREAAWPLSDDAWLNP